LDFTPGRFFKGGAWIKTTGIPYTPFLARKWARRRDWFESVFPFLPLLNFHDLFACNANYCSPD
jgi:hypothetical protein